MTDIAPDQRRPIGICHNCWVTWRARRPRPPGVYCHHFGNAARFKDGRWKTLESVSDRDLAELRKADLL